VAASDGAWRRASFPAMMAYGLEGKEVEEMK
jgi:hypothetical protein